MDKETLSNYGWIVICVLVLAVMIALATPFGSFIADGFKATYAGFGMVGDNALGIVIPGAGDGENDGNTGDVPTDTTTINVPGLGEAEVNNPNIKLTYNPDTGEVGGVIPPANEPETPVDIPEDKLPEIIEFGLGKFESKTTHTPGTYETVPYETTHTKIKYPSSYKNILWSKWHVTKDANDNITNVVPMDIELSDIDKQYSTYIIYDFETDQYLEMEGVKGDSVELWAIYDSAKDTKENIIYLAAYLNKVDGNTNRHIAKWDGSKYIAVDYDAEVNAIDTFTETYTVTETKQIQITAPSTSVDYVYVPVGTLKAEAGMTWAEWLVSDYNTTGETAPTIKTSDFEDVSYNDVIDENKDYGFMSVQINIIPEGGTYAQCIDGRWEGNVFSGGSYTKYTAGDEFPATVNEGDYYQYGDYTYTYYAKNGGWKVSINLVVTNKSQSTYGEILGEINGTPTTSLEGTFSKCSLTSAPKIPDSVTNMKQTFNQCLSLKTAPIIPSKVSDMTSTFYDCRLLTGTITINANPTSYGSCFKYTQKAITLTGASSMLNDLASTQNNNNITVQ